ncbi:prolipoprotein diacylglyceryl transferase [Candidatus Poribacteria bacterium]|nr:prolipoprotein diacylglyceryl transferase [Candidatus Poribacteria bacterium]
MYPTLIQFGPVGIHTFGIMMGLGFLAGYALIRQEYLRKGIDPELASTVILAAIIGGVLGAKLYFWRDVASDWRSLLSGSGLAWHGGLAGGIVAVLIVLYRSPSLIVQEARGASPRRRIWEAIDGIAPAILLGQAFGRMGCFLSGDGDYGAPSSLPWAVGFPNGTVPTPAGVRVHPTMLYDIVLLSAAFIFLWRMRRRWGSRQGVAFGAFLILMGIERIITEFWRLTRVFSFTSTPMGWENRSLDDHLLGTAWQGTLFIHGISEQQLWSLAMVVVGVWMVWQRGRRVV